ncbi:MAG: hypothetical protein JJ863_01125 [Deltaproteobacteria bacterium]|nr:hypothetical protein [Deltaproteobacteria bacterium]
MRRILLWSSLVGLLAVGPAGCGDDADIAPAEPANAPEPAAPEPQPEPTSVAEPEPGPAAEPPEPPPVVPEPLATPPAPSEGAYEGTIAGLPAVAPGGRVRLEVVHTSTERVDGRRVPRAAIADADAKASLDPLLDDFARGNRCQIKLATETFVSVECAYEDEMDLVSGMRSVLVRHFQVGDDGRFAPVSTAHLLHPPASGEAAGGDRTLLQLLGRGTEPDDSDIVFLRTGLQIIPRSEDYERQIVGWRLVAPYLRADSALGRELAAQGLELAPEGTAMPELPAETWMVRLMEVHDAAHGFMALPPELQADVRLVEPPGLILAPGHERSDLPDLDVGEWEPARWIGPLATFGMRQVKEDDELRANPGATNEDEDVPVTAGERLYTVEGVLGDRRSSPDRGWCFGFSCETRDGRTVCIGGWIRARNLEVISDLGGAGEPAEGETTSE